MRCKSLLTCFCFCYPITVERQRGALCDLVVVKAIVVHKIRKADFLSSIKMNLADFLGFTVAHDFYLVISFVVKWFCRFFAC